MGKGKRSNPTVNAKKENINKLMEKAKAAKVKSAEEQWKEMLASMSEEEVKLFIEKLDVVINLLVNRFFTSDMEFLSGNKMLIQKKILNTDILDAVFIPPRLHVVLHHNDFLERIGDPDQGGNLLLLLFRIIDG